MLLHLQFSVGVRLDLGELIGHGYWAVDVFFVLSGYILSYIYASQFESSPTLRNYFHYLTARFARIYPLHIFAIGILAAALAVRAIVAHSTHLPTNLNLHHLALNIFLIHGWGYANVLSWNFPSWSISSEWFAYLLLLPALCRYLRKWPATLVLVVATAIWTLFCLALSGQDLSVGEQTVSWAIPRIVCEFSLGYGLYRLSRQWQQSSLVSDFLALGGTTALVLMSTVSGIPEWWLAPTVAALVLGLAKPGPLGELVFGNRIAVYWGERSYAIYMLHGVIQFLASMLVLRLPFVTSSWAWPLLVVEVLLVFLASDWAYRRIEAPARTRLRTLFLIRDANDNLKTETTPTSTVDTSGPVDTPDPLVSTKDQ